MTASGPFDVPARTHDSAAEAVRARAAPDYRFSPAGIARISANDLDEATEQIRDWRVEFTQLERGPARIEGILVPLGNTLVGRGRCNKARYTRGAAPGASVSFLFNSSDAPGRVGSCALDANTCVLYGGGAELNHYSAAEMAAVAVTVSASKWAEIERASRFALDCGDGQAVPLATSAECIRSLNAVVDELCATLDGAGHRGVEPRRIAAFEEEVLGIISSMLGMPARHEPATRERVGRHRAVMRAQEFIHENLGEPLSLLRLCDASLASARTLEYGFRELFGVSPLTYVRFQRLARVHRELYRTRRTDDSVTDVAMRWGFWHLGQFSKDYRGLFGECPSTTLSRGRCRSVPTGLSAAPGHHAATN